VPVSLARNSAAAETKTERSGGAGRKVGLGEMNFYQPAPLQILGEICSNFFERTPQIISDGINNVYSSNRVIVKIVIYYQLILIFETSIIKI